jgi:hypothetical protein
MKNYSKVVDYQDYVASYNKAVEDFKVAKNTAKEFKALLSTSKKADDAVKVTRFQYKQARLKAKSEKINARIAKLNLKGFIKLDKKRKKDAQKAIATASEKAILN